MLLLSPVLLHRRGQLSFFFVFFCLVSILVSGPLACLSLSHRHSLAAPRTVCSGFLCPLALLLLLCLIQGLAMRTRLCLARTLLYVGLFSSLSLLARL